MGDASRELRATGRAVVSVFSDRNLRLMEIADRTHDPDLRRQAEELDALAWDTYNLRTAHLASGAAPGGPDEETLTRRAGPGTEQPGAALLRGSDAGRDGGRLAERRER